MECKRVHNAITFFLPMEPRPTKSGKSNFLGRAVISGEGDGWPMFEFTALILQSLRNGNTYVYVPGADNDSNNFRVSDELKKYILSKYREHRGTKAIDAGGAKKVIRGSAYVVTV